MRRYSSIFGLLAVSGLLFVSGCEEESILAPDGLSWKRTSTFSSSAISSLVINRDGVIYAGTRAHGVMRSTDNGTTWEYINTGMDDRYINSLALSSDGVLFAGSHSSIYRCADGGAHWTKLDYGPEKNRYFRLALDPDGGIYAVGYAGAIRSLDGGETWEDLAALPFALGCHTLIVNEDGHIFAVAGDIVRSTDRGESWEIVYDNQNDEMLDMFSLDVSPDGSLYAGGQNGVYISSDNGETWNLICEKCPGTGPYDPIVIDSTTGHLYAGYYDGVSRSLDGGYSWEPAGHGISDKRIECIAINGTGEIFAGASFGALYRSCDRGNSWSQVNVTSLPITANVSNIVVCRDGRIFCTTYYDGIFRSDDNGATWNTVSSARAFCLVAKVNGYIYAGTWNGIMRSYDNGDSWQPREIAPSIGEVSDLCIDARGFLFAAVPFAGVYYSIDDGDTWIHMGLTDNRIRGIRVSADGTICAGGDKAVFIYRNENSTWQSVESPYENMHVRFLVLRGEKELYVGKEARLLRLNTDLLRWYELKDFFDLFSLLAPAEHPGLLIACSWGYIDYSANYGASWMKTSSGFTHKYVRSLAIDNDGYILAGTGVDGIYRSTVTASHLARRY